MKIRRTQENGAKKKTRLIAAATLVVLTLTAVRLFLYALDGVRSGIWMGGLCLDVLICEILLLISGYVLVLFLSSSCRRHGKPSDFLYGEK